MNSRPFAFTPEDIAALRDPGIVGWPEPALLGARVEPEAYPLDALPSQIRDAVKEVQSFVKAPVPLVASSALGAVSLAIQAHYDVQRAERLQGPVSLSLLTIADSGERKSTCDSYFTSALRDWQQEQTDAASPLLEQYSADMQAWEARQAGLKANAQKDARDGKREAENRRAFRDLQDEKPEPPRIPRLFYSDVTPEALSIGLGTKWPSAGVMSSEAGAVFGSHGMGKDSIMRNLSMLNELWDGKPLTFDRVTRDSVTVRGARLTVALQVQEATLRAFFERSGNLARGTGFLARFLVAWPGSTQGMRLFQSAPTSWPALTAFNRRVRDILDAPVPMAEDGGLTPVVLSLDPEAYQLWREFHDTVEGELGDGGELYDVRDVASKAADNAARLAALFQVIQHGMGGAVGSAAFDGASRIVSWHLNESRRFFGELAMPPELANAARLDRWLIADCQRGRTHIVSRRKIQNMGPHGLRDKAALDAALKELTEAGRVRVTESGRKRDVYVNPALLGGVPV